MLNKAVYDQNDQLSYQGGPEISLDQLTLTTNFQLILEASAGTRHIFRIFPLTAPPQMGLKAEHLHQVKIVLRGQKRKGDVNEAINIERSCKELVLNRKAGQSEEQATAFCSTPAGKLLTKIVDSLDNNKGGSSGGQ